MASPPAVDGTSKISGGKCLRTLEAWLCNDESMESPRKCGKVDIINLAKYLLVMSHFDHMEGINDF